MRNDHAIVEGFAGIIHWISLHCGHAQHTCGDQSQHIHNPQLRFHFVGSVNLEPNEYHIRGTDINALT